jgi:hypothetical protein
MIIMRPGLWNIHRDWLTWDDPGVGHVFSCFFLGSRALLTDPRLFLGSRPELNSTRLDYSKLSP